GDVRPEGDRRGGLPHRQHRQGGSSRRPDPGLRLTVAWTTPQDVLDRWVGDGRPTDEALIEKLIGDAEDHLVFEYPDLPGRVDDGDPPVARVQRVVAAMVTRVLRNPKGVRQQQITTGPFQRGETFAGD